MKVYIVTAGEYSDYHIEAVFTSKERAEAFAALDDDRGVDEEETDPVGWEGPPGLLPFKVYMKEDGSLSKDCCGRDRCSKVAPRKGKLAADHFYRDYFDSKGGYPMLLVSSTWARDEQHAVKIVNERRVQHIANGTWGKEFTR